MKTHSLILSFFILCFSFSILHAQPSFPGAEGWGASTPGGRGGQVLIVTNTNAAGQGSFYQAIKTPGPRIIVFNVSGVITWPQGTTMENESQSNVTIAGQTSPGGITLTCNSGTPIWAVRWHDGIIRFIRFRVVRNTGGNGGDHSFGFSRSKNFIVDHCDFSGGDDECFDIMYSSHFTIQWSTIANSGPGGQQYGLLMNGTDNPDYPLSHISIHHSLFANHSKRGPEIHWGYGATEVPDSGKFDFVSNVVYNIHQFGVYFSVMPSLLTVNLEGNYFKKIGDYYQYYPPVSRTDSVKVYIKDNFWDTDQKPAAAGYDLIAPNDPDTVITVRNSALINRAMTPWDFPPVTAQPAMVTRDTVCARVGAWPRDSMNKRTVYQVINSNTGELGNCSEPNIASGPAAPTDSDNDGMPDFWETGMGLNPNDPSDNAGDHDSDEYMNIEEYINDLANARVCRDYSSGTMRELSVSPNPWQGGNLTIRTASNQGEISVIDIQGREVARFKAGRMVTWDAKAGIAPGVYIVRHFEKGRLAASGKVIAAF
jgi:pectate lyase